jgi:hypothetical protein
MTVKPQNSMDECPNITDTLTRLKWGVQWGAPTGVFYAEDIQDPQNQEIEFSQTSRNNFQYGINAAASSAIYGASNSVQPSAMASLILIKF